MCVGCSKRRGSASHEDFVVVVRFDLRRKIEELTALDAKLSEGQPATKPAKPAPKAESAKPKASQQDLQYILDNWDEPEPTKPKASQQDLQSIVDNWDEPEPTKPKFKYPTTYKAADGTVYNLANPDTLQNDIITMFPEDYPFVDKDNPHFNERVYEIWSKVD